MARITAIIPNQDALNYWQTDRSWFWIQIRAGNFGCAIGQHKPPRSPEAHDEMCPRCCDGHAWKYMHVEVPDG